MTDSASGGGSSAEEPPPAPFFPPDVDPFGAPPPYAAQPPQIYGPPTWQTRYPMPTNTNGFAIASLVFSLLWLLGLGSLLGVVFGIVALNQLGTQPARGRALAIVGIVVGALGLVATLLVVVAGLTDTTSQSPTV